MQKQTPSVGQLLRMWREHRRLSQLALSLDAGVSAKHISFLESGRAAPSKAMVLTLAEVLSLPLRARNDLFLAAGLAPMYPQHGLDDPELASARRAIETVLRAHEPSPAIAVDRHWNLVTANRAFAPLVAGLGAAVLAPPVNVLRLSLRDDGLAPRIVNLEEWREHVLRRLRHQIQSCADPVLRSLYAELGGRSSSTPELRLHGDLVAMLRLRSGEVVLSFVTTTTVLGTPNDVALSELAIESFFPADAATAEALKRVSR
ncbi:MAG TPA: helix-turn-helix transcriptional regulator [Polyangiaceae bacterium]|nr:helix-turn-helix transcriptional regulator [Polyangiaceae bacterium]